MRILLLANSFPWLKTNGLHLRLRSVLEALARVGDVDVFALVEQRFLDEPLVAPGGLARRIEVAGVPTRQLSHVENLRWFLSGDLPATFRRRDYARARKIFQGWASCRYDLAWFHRADTYVALGREIDAPAVVDFDDLEDIKILRALRARSLYGQQARSRREACVAGLALLREAMAWRRLQRRIAGDVRTVVVTNSVDGRRLAARNVEVVPNTYPPDQSLPPPPSQDRSEPRDRSSALPPRGKGRRPGRVGGIRPACTHPQPRPPTITFQGDLTYAPNVEACLELVTRIAPLVRAEVPQLQVRLVGEVDGRVQALADTPWVVVTDHVEDMSGELCLTDVVVVPLRYASGTRTKILEAFAHELAVVSTSIGAEGIDATDGRHLLVRDRVQDIAAACVHLLRNERLRSSLAARGRVLFLHRYVPEVAAERVAAIAKAAVAG